MRQLIHYILLLLFVLVTVFYRVTAQAAIVIDPALIKVPLTQKRISGVFYIKNVSDEEERYRATAVHFTVKDKGALSVIPPDEYSLAKWIKFNPTEFVLPPKTSRMVRYSIIPQGKLKDREYWGAIQFVPLKGKKFQTGNMDGQSMGVEVMTVILVPIYGMVKGTKFAGELKNVETKQEKEYIDLHSSVINKGEGILRLSGTCQVVNSAGKVAKEIPLKRLVVFTKTERPFQARIQEKLPPDKYTVKVKLYNDDKSVVLANETTLVYEKK